MTNKEILKLGIILAEVDGGCGPCAREAARACQKAFQFTEQEIETLILGMNNPNSSNKFLYNKEDGSIEIEY